ncbi:MAG: pyruvate kinase [Bacteroidales bacterium]|jgi:pyruvate kinase|nr:pyruvate kinase [Bacteroidales bacterium]
MLSLSNWELQNNLKHHHIMSHTKVIATIGPSTSSKTMLRKMFKEGINVCRLNFSHGTHEDHRKSIENIIELNQELSTNVTILADLQGPKLRIGMVENDSITLRDGEIIDLTTGDGISTSQQLCVLYNELPADVQAGEAILIDDGKLKLEVMETNRIDRIKAKIVHGGVLTSRKGINLPHTKVSLPSFTQKDYEDACFALEYNVDWIALSFVRSALDLLPLRDLLRAKKKFARIIAKIEKPEALAEIDAIIDASNGVMVARGDLGVEVPFDRVPMIQKEIVKKCIVQAKPVVIATQMLESMNASFRPTRAEANDVANAVLDGADALMLSGETATGKYPLEAVKAMKKVIDWTENHGFRYNRETLPNAKSRTFLPDNICLNACHMADQANAKAIVIFTFSGYTAMRISSHRPKAETFVFTRNKALVRKMALIWGAHAYHAEEVDNIDEAVVQSIENLKSRGYIKAGDVVVHVGSTPFKEKGQTNMLKLSYIQ